MASTSRLADRVAFLHGGKIITEGTYDEFSRNSDLPPVRSFFEGARTSRLMRAVTGPDHAEVEIETQPDDPGPGGAVAEPVVELVGVQTSTLSGNHVLRGRRSQNLPRQNNGADRSQWLGQVGDHQARHGPVQTGRAARSACSARNITKMNPARVGRRSPPNRHAVSARGAARLVDSS